MESYLVTISFNELSGSIMPRKYQIVSARNERDAREAVEEHIFNNYPNLEWFKVKKVELNTEFPR